MFEPSQDPTNSMPLQDIGNHLDSQLEPPVTYAITAVLSIALYNVLELSFLLFLTFRRRSGLYFWSFLVSSWGIAIYAIGFILNDFNVANSISSLYVTFIVLGWCAMVTGQSLVLYSRLHLIVRRKEILSFVRGMIIVDAIILHIPTIILCYGANSSQYHRFALPYAIFEKVQVSVFFVQESIISGLYVYETIRLLRSWGTLDEMHAEAGRRLMQHLLYMNIIVALLDISILVLEYAGRYASQTAVKGLVYSVKLKLEFNILNRLVELANRSIGPVSWLDYRDDGRNREHGSDDDVNRRSRKCYFWAFFANKVKKAIIGVADVQATEREAVMVNDQQSRITNWRAPGAVIQSTDDQLSGGNQLQ